MTIDAVDDSGRSCPDQIIDGVNCSPPQHDGNEEMDAEGGVNDKDHHQILDDSPVQQMKFEDEGRTFVQSVNPPLTCSPVYIDLTDVDIEGTLLNNHTQV